MTASRTTPDLSALVGLFYDSPESLGGFEQVSAGEMPAAYRGMLAHQQHMTVTVERFHNSPIDVEVLTKWADDAHYARKILLRKKSDGMVVQYGIMRIDFSYVSAAVRHEIERESAPLGRVLIEHRVLREVQLSQLWKVTPGDELRGLFGLSPEPITYGRTAIITCNGEPAIELLEIVTPL